MNHYVLLGVGRTADAVEIRSAFRALARRYHPDAGPEASAEKFRSVVEAYEILSDPARRRRYDATLARSPIPTRSVSAEPMIRSNGAEPLVSPNRRGPVYRRVAEGPSAESILLWFEQLLRDW